jgi:hypothetical protein
MNLEVEFFPLSESVIKKLVNEGFKYKEDFKDVNISDLMKGT